MMPFDMIVGKIAGAIYYEISSQFPHPALMLVPAITFKVRKTMEQITDLALFSEKQKIELAKDIKTSIIPMLVSYEIESNVIEKISPTIESTAYKALIQCS